jgi:hypothetical protein
LTCPEGEFLTGFDGEGNLLCAEITGQIPEPTPEPTAEPTQEPACYGEGILISDFLFTSCCEGLEKLRVNIVGPDGGCTELSYFICTDCGNGICEYEENVCNCSEDCQ